MPRQRYFPALGLTALVLMLLPGALTAQSVISVSPQQCVWRAGDDPAWAAPNLDESGWQPYAQWKPQRGQVQYWVRCHLDLGSTGDVPQPAVQVSMFAAYQLFLNGEWLGSAGNLRTGSFSINSIRSYPIALRPLPAGPSILALRISRREVITHSRVILDLFGSRLEIRTGDEPLLDALRARTVLAGAARFADTAICYGVIAVLGIMLFGLFFYDPSRRELLLLSVVCLSTAMLRLNEFCAASLLDYSLKVCLLFILVGNIGLTLTQVPFYYALARRRLPLTFRILLICAALGYSPTLIDLLLPMHQPSWLGRVDSIFALQPTLALHMALSVAPFLAFWPYKGMAPRMRLLVALCMLWSTADLIWFVFEATAIPIPGVPNLFARWGVGILETRAIITELVLAALLGLLFREQRQVTQERAMLAGEMLAASEIQRMLAPAALEAAPGLRIDVAFHPMRDVGGDFYQCRVLADGRQRVLLGDVSGKGTAAAMAATLLLGAAAARDSDSPPALLAHLNRVLGENRLGGFATCLCADVSTGGKVTIANAGHLAPYCNGKEVSIPSGLPVGVNEANADGYEEHVFRLAPGDRLTFLSDGVVEARNAEGELFGFERAAQLSTEPAENIAHAACTFGQEDDITVLTLQFAEAGATG